MKCYATYNLLNAESLDPALYPEECFQVIPGICNTPAMVNWAFTNNFFHFIGSTSCMEGNLPLVGSKTFTMGPWTAANWVAKLWNGPNQAGATLKATMTPTTPVATVAMTPDPTWWLSFVSTGGCNCSVNVT